MSGLFLPLSLQDISFFWLQPTVSPVNCTYYWLLLDIGSVSDVDEANDSNIIHSKHAVFSLAKLLPRPKTNGLAVSGEGDV